MKIMETKEIIAKNRESVISSIKWIFKIWKAEDVKVKMIEFLAFCEENMNAEEMSKSKRVKKDLKVLVSKMAAAQEKAANLKRKAAEIKEKYSAIPKKQVRAGIYIHTIGRKYITLLNTWGTGTLEKVEIDEFYENHM